MSICWLNFVKKVQKANSVFLSAYLLAYLGIYFIYPRYMVDMLETVKDQVKE